MNSIFYNDNDKRILEMNAVSKAAESGIENGFQMDLSFVVPCSMSIFSGPLR